MDFVGHNLILFIATFLIWIMFLGVLVLWLLSKKREVKVLIFIMITVTIAMLISQTIKMLFPYPRPFEIYNILPLTLGVPKDPSFPSTHTAVAFALAFSTCFYFSKYTVLFFISAIIVGLGRVLSNVHFWGDVAGGVLIGYLAYKITEIFFRKYTNKKA